MINYFLEKDQNLDKVLNIFIRINSGGIVLSYSDLLLSIATAQWQQEDAREAITSLVDELNSMGDGFRFDKDLVLKSSLVLTDFADIAFTVDNFNRENMRRIEKEWETISNALRGAVSLVSGWGYSRETLTANYAIIPIAYYLKKKGLPKNYDISGQYLEDREALRHWLVLALVKKVFGGHPDTVLRPLREILADVRNGFPLQKIIERFRGTPKSIICTEDDVENLLDHRYGQGYTFSILSLLYPFLDFRNRFHVDHIHPRSHFTKAALRKAAIPDGDIDFYMENVDRLPNLQLLEGLPNQEKSDTEFGEWLNQSFPSPEKDREKKEYMRKHFIPRVDLSFQNFREFFTQRKEMLKQELIRMLGVAKDDL